ncbi:hypothetical protein C2S52_008223 [Perilla frutescens var. hirtella]|nr:hypothetical protein C2S52_008223 [Perilla frutescens var. hirtella]
MLNPAFVDWHRQDQLTICWLLSSMTEGVLAEVLQTLKKGGFSMKDYLNKVKNCCDVLASAGEKITDDNQILHILTGLRSAYNPVMVSLTSRVETCTLREVKALLLSYESRLKRVEHSSLSIEGSSPTANIASSNQNVRSSSFSSSNRGHGGRRHNYRGHGGRYNNNYKPRCQICNILGHTADRCYERLVRHFTPKINFPTAVGMPLLYCTTMNKIVS